MAKFCEAKSDQLNNVDLISGHRIIKVTKVKVTETGKQDCTIWYEGDNGKPWKPCKSMGRIIMHAWGQDPQNYVGKYLELYRDPDQMFGPDKVGAIRIHAMSDIEDDFDLPLQISRGKLKTFKIKKLTPPAAPKPADDALLAAGDTAAKGGEASYIAWKDSLTPEQKNSIRPHHAEWAKIAKGVVI